ncbi:MAG: DNA polymerase III subunit delta [Ardenticatenaceae bacterium]|nr:DNA polymerase III subunit delta [Ardenticatenaceae bacterium]MCB9445499.1 DNA polymerase III subunit delta [Ardenticatenaceae bacterium]
MFYIFHGQDTHSQKEMLAKLTAKLGDPGLLDLNTTRLEGAVSLTQLQQACNAMPFLAKVRLVLVTNLLSSKPDKSLLKGLADFLPQLPETTRLVFMESDALPGNHRLIKLAEELDTGFVKQFDLPEGGALDRWVKQQVEERNGRISPHAAHVLASNVGSDLGILENEIEKLVLYKGTEETIEVQDVGLLSPYAAEASIFDLVDAIGNRNGRQAAILLQKKLQEGTDPFYLFTMIVRQIRLLIQARELADEGQRPPAISKAMNVHSFVASKLYQQAQQFSLPQLEQIYRHMLEVDVGVKTGRNDMVTALNLLVAGMTESN